MRNFIIGLALITILLSGCNSTVSQLSPMSPITIAALDGNNYIIEEELKKGVDIDNVSSTGVTPMTMAIASNKLDTVKYLIDHGAKIDNVAFGMTPLIQATYRNRPQIVKYLLSKGANINYRISDSYALGEKYKNKTALEVAQIDNYQEIIDLLSDINKKLIFHNTKFIKKTQIEYNSSLVKDNNKVIKKVEKKALTEDEKLEQWINQELNK